MKKSFKILILIAVALVIFVVARTFFYNFNTVKEFRQPKELNKTNYEQKIKRFSGGIKIPTVSDRDLSKMNFSAFDDFIKYLESEYPLIFGTTEQEIINEHSIVIKWKGSNPKLKPLLFLSHYDVVAPGYVDENYDKAFIFNIDNVENVKPQKVSQSWTYPPFSGTVNNGRIYGRGTLDMKGMLFGIMEAANELMTQGFVPERDIYFAFGHDEETGGINGATNVAKHLREKGLEFDAVYDEGGAIMLMTKGSKSYGVALVGIAEKGFLTLKINVRGQGGHSSMPPAKTSLGQMGILLTRLEDYQMDGRIIKPMQTVFKTIGGNLSFPQRFVIANQWLFKSLLIDKLERNNITNALVRTTTAPTRAKGSDGDNVLPPVAELTVNFRILPGDTVAKVIEHVRELSNGLDIDIEVVNAREPSHLSPTDTRGFGIIKEALGHVYPDAAVTPYITVGGTDAYKYESVSKNVYRLSPTTMTTVENGTIHNYDESISIENYLGMIEYFKYIMENYDQKK